MSGKSWWVIHRDLAVAAASNMFSVLVAKAGPAVEQAALNAGVAVFAAVKDGAVHGSDDVIDVALKSIRLDAPQLTAAVSTALAASVVEHAQQAAVQAAEDPGPPASER